MKAHSRISKRCRSRNHTRVSRGADFLLDNHGSVCILNAITPDAAQWVDDHLPDDALCWGPVGTVIEPRYVGDIVQGVINDGLVVRS